MLCIVKKRDCNPMHYAAFETWLEHCLSRSMSHRPAGLGGADVGKTADIGRIRPPRWHVLDGQFNQSAFVDVTLDGMHGHAAPAKAVEQESVLCEQISQSPRLGRHHAEFAPTAWTCRSGQAAHVLSTRISVSFPAA